MSDPRNDEPSNVDLDIRRFAKHVNHVGPKKAFMDFLYGMFVVVDEVLRTGANGKEYPKPPPLLKKRGTPNDRPHSSHK